MIHHISAVTFAVRDMARSVEFYRKFGVQQSESRRSGYENAMMGRTSTEALREGLPQLVQNNRNR